MVAVIVVVVLGVMFIAGVWRVTAARSGDGGGSGGGEVIFGSWTAPDSTFEDDPYRGVADPSVEDMERGSAGADPGDWS